MGLDDITSTRRISRSGTVVIVFHDLKPGSPYFNLVYVMKTKGANAKDAPLYANLLLMPRRSTTLYHIRKAHKEAILEKYYSN